MRTVLAEFLPQDEDVLVECAGGAKVFDSPAHVQKFIARNHLVWMCGKEKQQTQLCFSPLHVQHPANTAASIATTATIIVFFIVNSFHCELYHAETLPARNAAYYFTSG